MFRVSFNFITCQEVVKMDGNFLSCETWSVSYEGYWKVSIFVYKDTSHIKLLRAKKFLRQFCLHYQSFMKKF